MHLEAKKQLIESRILIYVWDCRIYWRARCEGSIVAGVRKLEYRGYDSAGILCS